MKLLTLASVMGIISLAGTQLKAQVTKPSAIVNTTLVTVTLADIIGAVPGTVGAGKDINDALAGGKVTSNVDFDYVTTANYAADQTIVSSKSINAMSSKSYTLSVKAQAADLVNGTDKIPVSILRLTVKKTSDPTFTVKEITPSTTSQPIFSAEPATSGTAYDVQYKIPKAEIEKYVSKKAGAYSVTIYYILETV